MLARTGLALTLVFFGLAPLGSTAAPFGRTAGQFVIPADGSANYSIPIWTPPGVAGLQPALSLNYNSRSGDGLFGVGWQMAGLSAISRCNLTYAQDGVAGSPQLASSDRFCLDGNRLRTTNGSTYGAAGATYQTEIANFANITSNGSAGSGPAWFKVQGKSGLTYEYGNTTDSAILASGSASVRVWALNAVRDRSGNAMTFTYINDTTNGSYRPASIQFTYTDASTTNNGYSIVFTYQSRPSSDVKWTYTIGGVNNQLNYLSAITVNTVSGSTLTMVHGYELTYVTAPTSSRLRISSIQECASSTTDCFAPTSIAYQDGTTGWGSEIANSGNLTNLAYAMPIDVNGDGIDDLVYPDPTSGHWYYELGTTSGTFAGPYDTGIASTNYQSALAIDFYVNGRKDILVPNSSNNWRVLQFVSAGAAFSYVDTTNSAAGVVPGSAIVGDVDGDGREDLIYAVSGGSGYAQPDYIYYRLNTGGAFSSTQGTLASFPNGVNCQPCVKLGNSMPFGNPAYRFNSQIRKLDFNGDGRTDLLVYLGSCSPESGPSKCGTTYPIIYSWTIFVSQPNGTYVSADAVGYSVGQTPNQPPLIGDFDGDGCTDLAYTVSIVWTLSFGTCGRAGVSSVLSAPVSTGIFYTSAPALALDWDGDGRSDIVQPNSASHWAVARSTGSTLNAWVDTGIASAGGAQAADVNGDGEEDLIYAVSNALKTRLHAGVPPDLATGFTDAYGVTYSPSYVALSQASSSVYAKGSSQVYPQRDYIGPLYVVPSYTASDGIGGTFTITNYYSVAVTNLQGRGFEGFTGVRANDSRTGIYDFKYYSTIFPTTGLISEDDTLQPNGTKDIRTITNALTDLTLDSTSFNQRYFPYVSTSTVKAYELGGPEDGELITTAVTNNGTPDSYGNFASVETTLTDNDTGSPYLNEQWSTTTASSFTEDGGSNWCLKLPTEVDVTHTAPGVSSITRHVSYTPDYTYCRQTQQVVEPSSSTYKVTTGLGYDAFGNLNSQTVTGVGMAARTTGINWGTSGQFPTILTNALNQQTHVSFDPSTGKELSQTDPNGITISWQYDTFARKVKEIRPDGTSTTWAYNNCATAGCVNSNNQMTVVATAVNTDNTTLTAQNSYLDTYDRPLITSKTMLNGAYDRNEVQYDNLGRVHLKGFPCTFVSCAQYWTTNTYDILNRLTESQRPISASNSTLQSTSYTYQGRTSTVTDAQNKVTTQVAQVTGALGRAKDHNGYYVNFNYDAFGSVLSVTDSLSNTLKSTVYGYGIAAFPQSSTDMDLGARTYTVDALGELTAYSDAKSQAFSVIYDALSRPTSRTEPDLTTTWTWGTTAGSYNIGKLASVTSASSSGTYSESYSYDSKGRPSDQTITIPSDGAHAFDYAYSPTTGLLSTLTYPTSASPSTYRVTAGYTYQHGILQQIYDSTTPTTIWWQANAMNPRGQITEETTSDSSSDPAIVTNRAYDAVTGWVGSIQTGVGGGSGLQNESYTFDYVGNVTQRQNNNAGLTENFYYDNLYRLDHSTLGGTNNLQMCYDNTGGACTENLPGMGNITSRSDIAGGAAWTYDPVRKHAVTQAGSSSYTYTYDANGNASTRNGSMIGWTSYNYPSSVATSTESATFDYGPNRQRWRMVYTGAAGPETTYYATPLYEKVVTSAGIDFRHYLSAGGRLVMVISRTSVGAINVRSLLVDHQGSISSIVANSTGSLSVSESFTAYGNRRESSTWTGSPTTAELNTMNGITREGYTFQTVLGSMGLNHMNGRIEDSITGRFLSADPQGEQPGNTQSWNRYSYVINNPLTLTDPSGFCTFLDRCVPYGGGHNSRPDVVGFADSSRSASASSFGEASIGTWITGVNAGIDSAEFDTGFGPYSTSTDSTSSSDTTASPSSPGSTPSNPVPDPGQTSAPSAPANQSPAQSQTSDPNAGGAQSAAQPGAQSDPNALPEICVGPGCGPQSYRDPTSGNSFYAPNGTDFQSIWQAGQNFRNSGGSVLGLGQYVGRSGIYNFQTQSAQLGLGYTYYQQASNLAVGMFMSGAGYSLADTLTIGQTFGFLGSSNFPTATTNWNIWWSTGWIDGYNQTFPAPVPNR
jgi:RHS repeat-associated protein